MFRSGSGPYTAIGYVSKNNQKNHGTRGFTGTDHGQVVYKLECLHCGNVYGANGTDVWLRKCPACQGGTRGLEF